MQLIRSIQKDGTLCPAAINYLGELPPGTVFHQAHQLRHPLSIYRLSLDNIADSLGRVAEQYFQITKEAQAKNTNPEFNLMLECQKNFLRSLQEHLDDCYLVLKALVNPATVKHKEIFADRFVLKNKLPGAKSFFDAITPYKGSLQIANKLKHQQGRLRGVTIFPSNVPHLGYYLEEPHTNGTLGASRDVHPDQGAFSFARDLSWHLFNVYLISEKLVKAVTTAVKSLHQTTLSPSKPSLNEPLDAKWRNLISSISSMPAAIFPKEVAKGIATFELTGQSEVLTIKFPVHVKVKFATSLRTSLTTVVDAYNPTYQVVFP